MKSAVVGFIAAVLLHAAVLLFGGALFFTDKEAEERAPARDVELFTEAQDASPAEPQEKDEEREKREPEDAPQDEIAAERERPPEMRELYDAEQTRVAAETDAVARLEALSLGAIESALSGAGSAGGEFFGSGASLASGGRIGGTGAPGAAGGKGDDLLSRVFDVEDLDQRARPVFQAPPNYPAELRQKKIEGTVYVIFVVDEAGRVVGPKAERSPHEGLDRAAVDAVRHWKFEPAVRGGQKVRSKVRIPIRFSLTA